MFLSCRKDSINREYMQICLFMPRVADWRFFKQRWILFCLPHECVAGRQNENRPLQDNRKTVILKRAVLKFNIDEVGDRTG